MQRSPRADRTKVKMRSLLITLAMMVATITAVSAQAVHSPDKTSPERKAILDTLRIPVERDLKQKVAFIVENLNVSSNWAFVSGTPQSATGGEPDYKITKYWQAKRDGMFDNNYFALLKRTAGNWKVVKYQI